MRMEKLTVKAQEALQEGQTLARRAGHPSYEPEHLALALLAQDGGIAEPLLRKVGADVNLVRSRLDEALSKLPKVQGGEGSSLGQRLVKTLDAAQDETKALKDEYTSSEHLLLALTLDRGSTGEILKSSGVKRDQL